MKTTKKTVRAYTIMWVLKPELDLRLLYKSKAEAERMNRMDILRWHRIVPVTITYELPVKKK